MVYSFEALIFISLVFLFAAFIHGSIGFTFPMISTSLLAVVTDLQTAIMLTLIPTILVNVVTIISEGNARGAFRQHFPLALFAMFGSLLGTQLLIYTDSEVFKGLLAFSIIFYLISGKLKIKMFWIAVNPKSSRAIFGLAAGVLGGLTNVMAPILIIYALESKYGKRQIIQASNLCFLGGKIVQLIMFSSYGQFSSNELSISMLTVCVVAVALYFGVSVKKKINAALYAKLLKGLLMILASILLVRIAF